MGKTEGTILFHPMTRGIAELEDPSLLKREYRGEGNPTFEHSPSDLLLCCPALVSEGQVVPVSNSLRKVVVEKKRFRGVERGFPNKRKRSVDVSYVITQRSVLQLSLTWRSRNLFTSGGELSRWKGGFYIEVFILDEKRRVLPIGESKKDFENKEPVQLLKGRCQPKGKAQEESKRCPSRFLCLCRTQLMLLIPNAAFKESLSPPTAADVAVPQNPRPMGEYKSEKNSTSGPRSTVASSSRFDPFLDTGASSAALSDLNLDSAWSFALFFTGCSLSPFPSTDLVQHLRFRLLV